MLCHTVGAAGIFNDTSLPQRGNKHAAGGLFGGSSTKWSMWLQLLSKHDTNIGGAGREGLQEYLLHTYYIGSIGSG